MSENPKMTPEQVLFQIEGNATWSVRYLDPTGFECQFSLEAASGTDLLKKAQRALQRLQEMNCSGMMKTPKLEKNANEQQTSICPIHRVEMKLWKKDGKSWYAHKVDGKWCNGK